jgi:hypothetical protein
VYRQAPIRIQGRMSIYLAFRWGLNDTTNSFHRLRDLVQVRAIRVGPDLE